MAVEEKRTRDHEEIRRWVEERGGQPATVETTARRGQAGLLRIDFPGYGDAGDLAPISWDEFFQKFDEENLEFLYQDESASGAPSRFNKFVAAGAKSGSRSRQGTSARRTTSKSKAGGHTQSKRPSTVKASTKTKKPSGSRSTATGGRRKTTSSRGKTTTSRGTAKTSSRTATSGKRTTTRGRTATTRGRTTTSRGRTRSTSTGSQRTTGTRPRRRTTQKTMEQEPNIVVGVVEVTETPMEEKIRWENEAPGFGGAGSTGPVIIERPEGEPKSRDTGPRS